MSLELWQEIIGQGLIYSLVTIGMYLTQRILRVDDLACEGSFSTGGAVTAKGLLLGISPVLMLPLALISGLFVGVMTGFIHAKLRIPVLLAGLCATCALFSTNLSLVGSNLSLPDYQPPGLFGLLMLCLLILFLKHWFLSTEIGLLLRASGDNPQMLIGLGKNPLHYKMLGLALANGLAALSGALFVQWIGFFSITGSIGIFMIGLASLMLAKLFNRYVLVGLLIGSILYQMVFAIVIELGMPPVWNNFVKAVFLIILMQMTMKKNSLRSAC